MLTVDFEICVDTLQPSLNLKTSVNITVLNLISSIATDICLVTLVLFYNFIVENRAKLYISGLVLTLDFIYMCVCVFTSEFKFLESNEMSSKPYNGFLKIQ